MKENKAAILLVLVLGSGTLLACQRPSEDADLITQAVLNHPSISRRSLVILEMSDPPVEAHLSGIRVQLDTQGLPPNLADAWIATSPDSGLVDTTGTGLAACSRKELVAALRSGDGWAGFMSTFPGKDGFVTIATPGTVGDWAITQYSHTKEIGAVETWLAVLKRSETGWRVESVLLQSIS